MTSLGEGRSGGVARFKDPYLRRCLVRRIKGFTLVELLVVIGIIAVLISILLPSLNRARESAKMIKCESNMRQVGMAVAMYVNDSKGCLPHASYYNDGGTSGTSARTINALSAYLGKRVNDESKDVLSPVFTCIESLDGSIAATAWAPNLIRTINFNPRAFPGYDQGSSPTLVQEFPTRKAGSIRNAAKKIAFWEGCQNTSWNYTTVPEAINLDGWRWNWSHQFIDPPADGDYTRWNSPVDSGANADTGWWTGSMRFRHFKNTAMPVGFFDGHVESRKINTVLVNEICVNK